MNNAMTYKGYSARIEYDDGDEIFFGRVAGIRDGVGFHADTVRGLRKAFREAVEDYIETCARIGKKPQKAFSGQVMFRVSPEVHRKAALAAELSGKSLNQWPKKCWRAPPASRVASVQRCQSCSVKLTYHVSSPRLRKTLHC